GGSAKVSGGEIAGAAVRFERGMTDQGEGGEDGRGRTGGDGGDAPHRDRRVVVCSVYRGVEHVIQGIFKGGEIGVGGVDDPVQGLCGMAAGVAERRGAGRADEVLEEAVRGSARSGGATDGPEETRSAEVQERESGVRDIGGSGERTVENGGERRGDAVHDVS